MEIQILVLGLTAYNEQELKEIVNLLKGEYDLKKLPSNDNYLLCLVPKNDVVEISEEMDELSKHHNNPAWEIISRNIESQAQLDSLATELYFEGNA
jgi:hypothetical protein